LGRRGKEGWFHQFGFGMPCARLLDRTRMNQCRRTGIVAASRYSRHELLLANVSICVAIGPQTKRNRIARKHLRVAIGPQTKRNETKPNRKKTPRPAVPPRCLVLVSGPVGRPAPSRAARWLRRIAFACITHRPPPADPIQSNPIHSPRDGDLGCMHAVGQRTHADDGVPAGGARSVAAPH
jgi:hypothetical protein